MTFAWRRRINIRDVVTRRKYLADNPNRDLTIATVPAGLKPYFSASGARRCSIAKIARGSETTVPSHTVNPVASIMQTEVSSIETSKPTYFVMAAPLFPDR
jgi:hypothetical protein